MRKALQEAGREGATEYGRALFREYVEVVSDAIEALFGRLLRGQAPAGRHYCAIPALLVFAERGMRPAAALALGVVIDQLSRRRTFKEVAKLIGKEIEDEARALSIQAADGDLLRLLKKRAGKRKDIVGQKVMQQLRLHAEPWSAADRTHVGGLLLDLVVGATGLVRVTKVRNHEDIEPTEEALAIIKANPPRPLPAKRLPMLVPPREWQGIYGGGHLGSEAPLVSSRKPIDLGVYEQADLGLQLQVVNALQRQTMTVDPWMVEVQRQAWDSNVRGLFPVQRDPMAAPAQPEKGAPREEWAKWHQQKAAAWGDEATGRRARVRIEECLRQCESVASRPVWFAYDLDFRGRVYSSNRYATHQGPDQEKGAISFAAGLPCNEEGFEWLLKAAAGHYGLSKKSWEERLQWGRSHLEMICSVAEEPLERLELWRGADDPWQFLQAARAIRQWLQDPSEPIGCPVRMDQTCSAVGICSALLRDKRLARSTNLVGGTRHDIYGVVAERVTLLLRREIEAGFGVGGKHAAFWLDFGVDRALMKAPVMTSVYGASHFTLVDGLVAALEERGGRAELWQLQAQELAPARYLAKVIKQALQLEVQACLDLQAWLKQVSAAVIKTQNPLRWTSPSGWPMHLGQEMQDTVNTGTQLTGKPRVRSRHREAKEGELSANATNRGITANLVHSFDAALCHLVVSRAGEQRVQVLTNHDCFAAVPANAGWLHRELHYQVRELYKTDWLAEIAAEIGRRSGLDALPPSPPPGDLCPGEIGQNPYCFS